MALTDWRFVETGRDAVEIHLGDWRLEAVGMMLEGRLPSQWCGNTISMADETERSPRSMATTSYPNRLGPYALLKPASEGLYRLTGHQAILAELGLSEQKSLDTRC